jgi:hypothetical protein
LISDGNKSKSLKRASIITTPESNPNILVGIKPENAITKNPEANTTLVIIMGEPTALKDRDIAF